MLVRHVWSVENKSSEHNQNPFFKRNPPGLVGRAVIGYITRLEVYVIELKLYHLPPKISYCDGLTFDWRPIHRTERDSEYWPHQRKNKVQGKFFTRMHEFAWVGCASSAVGLNNWWSTRGWDLSDKLELLSIVWNPNFALGEVWGGPTVYQTSKSLTL